MKKALHSFILLIQVGISRICGPRSGGLSKVWLTDNANISSMTRNTAGEFTAITMVGAAVFVPFEFEIDTAMRKNAGSITNGSGKVDHTVEMYFGKPQQTTRNRAQEIIDSSACGIVAICQDNNGNKWVEGWSVNFNGDRAMKLKTGDIDSGKVFTDTTGSTIVLESTDNEYANTYTGSVPV